MWTIRKRWVLDRYEKLQPLRPNVDENMIGEAIEKLWHYTEEVGTVVQQWCQGIVVATQIWISFTLNGKRIV